MKLKGWGTFAVAALLAACSDNNQSASIKSENDGRVKPKVVYGTDNRVDIYNELDSAWVERASSTVALFLSSSVKSDPAGGYSISLSSYGASQQLCPTEPFYTQVTGSFCSGALIAPDIIMTAGHCMRAKVACATTKFIFDYGYKTPYDNLSHAEEDNVYSCKEVIHAEQSYTTLADFALVRLDRPVVGRSPLPIRKQGDVQVGDPLTVIGNPTGIPTKIAGGAAVRKNDAASYFVANTDTYGGNSGSAVFNSGTGLIEGILVRGEADFVYAGGCYRSNVCKEDGCRGEDVTRISLLYPYLNLEELPDAASEIEAANF